MKRNLTIQLDETVIQKARVVAARRFTSISKLVSIEIEKAAEADAALEAVKETALSQLSRPFRLGGVNFPVRDSLHER
jgi:hypothetical protein